jgi:sigma-B regulation protein RsbU (phosphoserine phosphatase)
MSQQVGGDYLDCLEGVNGEYIVTIADVSGHGVDSALLMTSFRSTYRAESLRTEPDVLLNNLNNVMVHEVGDTGMFLTTVTLKIAADGRSFSFSSAGHNPFLLYRASEDQFFSLESSGPPLGVMRGVDYLLEEVVTESGDVLVLYTDGVVEATAFAAGDDFEEEDMFGEERLKDLVRDYHNASSTEIKDRVFQEVRDFSGMQTQSDDVSMMVVKFS